MHDGTEHVLKLFEQLAAIPRPSKHEEQAARWIVDWADSHGLDSDMDERHNVLVRVPGKGKQAHKSTVVLQGHLDMVCESTPDTDHDCRSDPIVPIYKDGWLSASGTTLGADNGIAVSVALAIAQESELSHPPLELLFTVDEETGLNGAKALRRDFVSGRRLINIDSEDEGTFTVGCAGGQDSTITLAVEREVAPIGGQVYRLHVGGLKGGHSGAEIHLHRGNANRILARALARLSEEQELRLLDVHGGSAHNAIPRDATAAFWTNQESRAAIETRIDLLKQKLMRELGADGSDLFIRLAPVDTPELSPMSLVSTRRVVNLVLALPHGIDRMSDQIDGLVETSSNLATLRTEDSRVIILTSQRSSLSSRLEQITGQISSTARLAEAFIESTEGYPAWEPSLDSELLREAKEVYAQLFGVDPRVDVIHAGLECGVIGAIYPDMDMISIGPTIRGAHSPDERLSLESLDRLWQFVVSLLSKLP